MGCGVAGARDRGSDLQVRRGLPAGLELPLPALAGGDQDLILCGREGSEEAEAADPVRLLREGGSASLKAVAHGLFALLQRFRTPLTRTMSRQIPTIALTAALATTALVT